MATPIVRPGPNDLMSAPGTQLDVLWNDLCDVVAATEDRSAASAAEIAAHVVASAPHVGHATLSDLASSIAAHEASPLHALAQRRSGPQIAVIGDSLAYGYDVIWSVPCASPTQVPTAGVFVHCRGAEDEVSLGGTGTLEVNADGLARWAAPADTPGPWVPALGKRLLPSGSDRKGLYVFFWAQPSQAATLSVVLAAYRTAWDTGHMSGGGSLATCIRSALGAAGGRVVNLGAGGAQASHVLGLQGYFADVAGVPGFDVICCGTNSVAVGIAGEAIAADIVSLLTQRTALGRKVVVLGISPRYQSGSTPLSDAQQAAARLVNATLCAWCETMVSESRFVDPVTLLQDPNFGDFRPGPQLLKDEVHWGYAAIQKIGPAVVGALQELGAALKERVPEPPVWKDGGYGRMLGSSGTAGAGTTTVGGLPTGWTSHNTGACLSTIEVVTSPTHQRRALDVIYSSAGGAGQYARVYSAQMSLSTFGIAPGDPVRVYAQIEVVEASSTDTLIVQCVFVGASGKMVQLSAGAVLGVHRLSSGGIRVPAGTTGLQFFVYALCSSATTGRLRVCDICVAAGNG